MILLQAPALNRTTVKNMILYSKMRIFIRCTPNEISLANAIELIIHPIPLLARSSIKSLLSPLELKRSPRYLATAQICTSFPLTNNTGVASVIGKLIGKHRHLSSFRGILFFLEKKGHHTMRDMNLPYSIIQTSQIIDKSKRSYHEASNN